MICTFTVLVNLEVTWQQTTVTCMSTLRLLQSKGVTLALQLCEVTVQRAYAVNRFTNWGIILSINSFANFPAGSGA